MRGRVARDKIASMDARKVLARPGEAWRLAGTFFVFLALYAGFSVYSYAATRDGLALLASLPLAIATAAVVGSWMSAIRLFGIHTGHLVYARMGTLMAVPFDVTRLEVSGGPIGIVDDVMQSVNSGSGILDTGAAQFSVSASGSLVYVPGGIFPDFETSLVWVDRSGITTPLRVTPRRALLPRISPDGTQLVFLSVDRDLWTFDISRSTTSRLSTAGRDTYPIWTPDGTRVTFSSTTSGPENLFWKPADGSGEPERLTTSERAQRPTSWSPNGKALAFLERSLQESVGLNFDIWILALENGGVRARPFIATPFNEQYAEFSPDGRWLAYSSNESGRDQVYVQPYPGPGGKQQVSVEGGLAARG